MQPIRMRTAIEMQLFTSGKASSSSPVLVLKVPNILILRGSKGQFMHFVTAISQPGCSNTYLVPFSSPSNKITIGQKCAATALRVLSWNLPELSNHRPDKEDCSFDGNDIILFENACTHYTNVDVWLVYLKPDSMPVN